MDKKRNEIHKNSIPMTINNHTNNKHKHTPYNWPAFLVSSFLFE